MNVPRNKAWYQGQKESLSSQPARDRDCNVREIPMLSMFLQRLHQHHYFPPIRVKIISGHHISSDSLPIISGWGRYKCWNTPLEYCYLLKTIYVKWPLLFNNEDFYWFLLIQHIHILLSVIILYFNLSLLCWVQFNKLQKLYSVH